MAEGKKGFVLYCDLIYSIEHLTLEEKGMLLEHLLLFVNDKNPPDPENRIVLTAWKPIERQLKRDLKKYTSKKEERSISGQLGNLKRYNLDLYKRVKSEEITLERALKMASDRKSSHSDTKLAVKDTVTVTVKDTDIIDKSITIEDLPIFEQKKEVNTELTEALFLKRWCDARTYYDKKPTNITKLTTYELIDFNQLKKTYGLKDFERAMQGLFQQKTYPKTRLRPSHFLKLENFETYLTCFTTKEVLFKDNKYKKPIERI